MIQEQKDNRRERERERERGRERERKREKTTLSGRTRSVIYKAERSSSALPVCTSTDKL
jgi:hypothetical protein